jgi:hypothetical protein
MNETLSAYLDFLWKQFQYDWSVFTNPWVLFPVLPALLYFIFFWMKWYILLIPVTMPITLLSRRSNESTENQSVDVKKKLTRLLKG